MFRHGRVFCCRFGHKHPPLLPDIHPVFKTVVMRYVFIITYGRSGSTLLQALLNSLPGYDIRGENANALLPLFRSCKRAHRAYGTANPDHRQVDSPWYGAPDIDVNAYANDLVKAFKTHILCETRKKDIRVTGFKEVRYLELDANELEEYLDFIRHHFASARFLFNVRKAEDVAQSSWWRDRDQQSALTKINDANQRFTAYCGIHSEDCHLVDYDAITADIGALKPLFTFLGEPFDSAHCASVLARKLTH